MNRKLINNKNSTVSKTMKMYCKCIMSAVSKIYIVTAFIVACNLSIKLKDHLFPDMCLY